MEDSTRVDLQQLKERLAKLGVHIQEPEPEGACWEVQEQPQVRRHNNALAQILGRCARMQQQFATTDDDQSPDGSCDDAVEQQAPTGASTKRSGQQGFSSFPQNSRSNNSTAEQLRAQTSRHHSRHSDAPGALRDRSSAAAAAPESSAKAAAKAAAVEADSKLLVRAAQQLLEDAQQDAQQVGRSLKAVAASAGAGRKPPVRAGTVSAGSCGRKSTGATVAGAASVDDLRNSPLGTVLAQYKEAQAAWAQEKAMLRREAVAARKEASQVRLELAKVSRSSEHRTQEASCLKAALKGRDVLLEELQARARQLEGELARCQEVAAERLVSVSRERDDLQALLLATLERLEGVEAVVAAADATSAAMEEKVRVLEAERLAALQTAATARQEVCELQEARRRLEWQSQLMEKMSKVQLQQNKRKSEALRELLATTEAAAGAAAAAECEASPRANSSSTRARESCSKASAALQDLLNELVHKSAPADEQ